MTSSRGVQARLDLYKYEIMKFLQGLSGQRVNEHLMLARNSKANKTKIWGRK